MYKSTGKHQQWRASEIGHNKTPKVKVRKSSNRQLSKEEAGFSMTGRTFITSFFFPKDAKRNRNRNK